MALFSFLPQHRNTWVSVLLTAGLVGVAVFLTISAGRIILRAREIHEERRAQEAKIQAAETKQRELGRSWGQAGSAEAVERMAKERMNLKNPGEAVVVVEPPRAATTRGDARAAFFFRIAPTWLQELFHFLLR